MPYNTTAIPPRKEPTGQTQLPLSRVKKVIAQDPDVNMCSNNAAFVITLAAEMFLQHVSEQAHIQSKLDRKPRRNMQYKDVANAVAHHDHLEFLEDMVPKTTPLKKAKANAAEKQAKLRGEPLAAGGLGDAPVGPGDAAGGAAAAALDDTRPGTAGSVELIVNGMNGRINGGGFNENGDGTAAGFRLAHDSHGGSLEDDPNDQLELEMRQAEKDDVEMKE